MITHADDADDGTRAPDDPLTVILRPPAGHLAPPPGRYEAVRRGAVRRRLLRTAVGVGATCALATLVVLPLRSGGQDGPAAPVVPMAPPPASSPSAVPTPSTSPVPTSDLARRTRAPGPTTALPTPGPDRTGPRQRAAPSPPESRQRAAPSPSTEPTTSSSAPSSAPSEAATRR
ncbi:hypothetical protein [Streptomyces sp. NPDC088766]|uniref:hypothetical protein n=1 Tax=Streptomyces sp. NPDC088766 TaxID=3365893 RepID=UPI00381446A0